jgi:hypothetical protein
LARGRKYSFLFELGPSPISIPTQAEHEVGELKGSRREVKKHNKGAGRRRKWAQHYLLRGVNYLNFHNNALLV